jgi:NAD dependent epimerase/dehydratase
MSKFWQGRRVLVTGAGGFIGSHLAEELARRGAIVRAFVHYNALGRAGWLDESAKELRDSMDIVAGDLREYDVLNDAARECDTIFHLGALIAIPYSYRSPLGYVRTNVEGTVNVLEAARAAGVRRVINTSTSEVYGTAISVPIAETHPLQGQSPYAASKIGADAIAESYHRSFGVPVATARPFNTFGPRQSARAVIPAILAQLLAGVTELQLGNLTPTRDFNFVMNTVEGMLALGEAPRLSRARAHVQPGLESRDQHRRARQHVDGPHGNRGPDHHQRRSHAPHGERSRATAGRQLSCNG